MPFCGPKSLKCLFFSPFQKTPFDPSCGTMFYKNAFFFEPQFIDHMNLSPHTLLRSRKVGLTVANNWLVILPWTLAPYRHMSPEQLPHCVSWLNGPAKLARVILNRTLSPVSLMVDSHQCWDLSQLSCISVTQPQRLLALERSLWLARPKSCNHILLGSRITLKEVFQPSLPQEYILLITTLGRLADSLWVWGQHDL